MINHSHSKGPGFVYSKGSLTFGILNIKCKNTDMNFLTEYVITAAYNRSPVTAKMGVQLLGFWNIRKGELK
jgi:hypothetical protein